MTIFYHFVTVLSLSDLSCKCKGHYRTHFLQKKYIYILDIKVIFRHDALTFICESAYSQTYRLDLSVNF